MFKYKSLTHLQNLEEDDDDLNIWAIPPESARLRNDVKEIPHLLNKMEEIAKCLKIVLKPTTPQETPVEQRG